MQRLVHLATGTSRFFRVVGINHLKNNELLFEQASSLCNTNNLILKRCLATKNKESKPTKNMDVHADLYKPSTAKEETHVPDDLKGHHQPTETITTTMNATSLGGGKVWSTQGPDNVHVAPLGRANSTTFIPKSTENGQQAHQTTVYSTQGKVNIADPFKTHTLQPEATPAKLAEAAAASAFETFAPDTPLTSTPVAEAVFAPKISSTDLYSTTSSPTSHFETTVSSASPNESVKYEAANKPKVFGGQDTSADSKKHPKGNSFSPSDKDKPRQAK